MIAIIMVVLLLTIGAYVFSSIALGKIFVKLGEQAWKGWIPIVNIITLFELGRYSALWVLGLFIPAANLVALVIFIMAINNVNRRLGHGGGFTLLYLVSFPTWAGVLGFGKSVDTGWMPATAATGYVPFAPVTPLSMMLAASAPAGQSVMTPMPPALTAPPLAVPPPVAPAFVAPPLAEPPLPPAPPTAVLETAPPAPPVARGRPTGPPPFYVSAQPVLPAVAAPPVLLAPERPQDPPVPPAVSAPPTATAAAVSTTAPSFPAHAAASVNEAASAPSAPSAVLDAGAEADDDDLDETMIVVRRMKPWTLETEHGLKVSLTKPVVLLGRNPVRGGAHADAQLVLLHDPGRTVSKTHARLDFIEGAWGILDLHSTNGVVLIDGGGIENELDEGASAPLTDRFLLGELAARIYLEA
jgi:hypothetical protein